MTPEGRVKQRIDNLLKKHDIWYFKPRGTIMGRSGIPDYICCIHGNFIGIEAKAGKNTLTALQVKEKKDIENHGGLYLEVRDDNLVWFEKFITGVAEGYFHVKCNENCNMCESKCTYELYKE